MRVDIYSSYTYIYIYIHTHMQHECLYGSLLMPGYLSEIASKISSSRANVALRHGSALPS